MTHVTSRRLAATIACACCALALAVDVSAQDLDAPADRAIERVQEGLYQVRDDEQYTMFLVTSEGIVLSDPLNRSTATWLKEELASRYPDLQVHYVLQTHHHFDRAEGAAIFNETAQLVGHERFNAELSGARGTIPPFLRGLDLNGNGRFERTEIAQAPPSWRSILAARETSGDGSVTPGELYAIVRNVERSYRSTLTIRSGDRQVDLIHVPSDHAADMTVLHLVDARVVFAVDIPPVTLVPFTFDTWQPRDVFRWLHAVTPLDFDVVLTGRGERIPRADLLALREYLDALRDEVAASYFSGQNLRDVQRSVTLDAYSASPHFPARTAQIQPIYQSLRWFRLEVSGRGVTGFTATSGASCAGFTTCSTGGGVTGVTMAAALALGRRADFLGELTLNRQSWSVRTSPLLDEEFAFRHMTTSFLLRIKAGAAGRLSVAPVAGVSLKAGDVRGMDRVKHAVAPFGGRHPIAFSDTRVGLTWGADVSALWHDRWDLVLPIRMTVAPGSLPARWPGRFDMQVGAGLAISLLRRLE